MLHSRIPCRIKYTRIAFLPTVGLTWKFYKWRTVIACASVCCGFRICRTVFSFWQVFSRCKLMWYTWSVSTCFLLYTWYKFWITGYSVPLIQPYQVPASGVFVSCLTDKSTPDASCLTDQTPPDVSCLTDKRPPDISSLTDRRLPGAPSSLRYSPSVLKEAWRGYVVIMSFKKANRNPQFYSRCW
jgi:hypothetical protein